MGTFRVRLSVEGLETRETPAGLADVYGAYAQTQANAAMIRTVSSDFAWMANPVFRNVVQQFARNVFQQSNSAITMMEGARPTLPGSMYPMVAQTEAAAHFNAAVAQNIANWLGFTVVTPPAPRPATDAGMTNTMPDPNSPSWTTQANGLKVWDVVQGTGTPVATGASVTVFYTGWLASNGTKFDSRRSPQAPVTFQLANLIQGWQQGVPGMRNGGIRRLFIPAALGYGANGSPPNVPPNADLIFEIKLVSHT
jgi:FKBP-type peptidyl-prolyl cis-trans isomerase FkpA